MAGAWLLEPRAWARRDGVQAAPRQRAQRPHAHEGITVQIYEHRSIGHDRDAAELVAGLIRRRLDDAPETG